MNGLVMATFSRNEEKMLRKVFPHYVDCFKNKIALDTGSLDGTKDVLTELGFEVSDFEWNWNYSDARNRLIDIAEEKGFEWMIMLDSDEAMMPNEIANIQRDIQRESIYAFPRYNLKGDTHHWESWSYPDYQWRMFPLHKGIRYKGKLHEQIDPAGIHKIIYTSHIYHYGSCIPLKQLWLKHHNYDIMKEGNTPYMEMPDWIVNMPDDEFEKVYCTGAPKPMEFNGSNPIGEW